MDRLAANEIAVVVQGPIFGHPDDAAEQRITQQGLASVRRHLPQAELVLSTWEGADPRGLEFDRLICSPDPGPTQQRLSADGEPLQTNVNRLIASTLAGLRATERPYALKARSDLWLRHAGFLDYFGRYPARGTTAAVFQERILIHDRYTRFPDRSGRRSFLFHPSDCFHFGRRDDLLTLWDQPLVKEPIALFNEQYLWVRCLQKIIDLPFSEWSQSSLPLHELAEAALVNNFVVLGTNEFGIESRHLPFDLWHWMTTYSHADWRQLYTRCCLNEPISTAPAVALKRIVHAIHQWPRVFGLLAKILNHERAAGRP